MVSKRFWAPSVTSQFCVCPIPFHFDTYRGCPYGCIYCFARDFIEFQRRNKDEHQQRQSFLEGNSAEGLKKWIEKVNNSDFDFSKAEQVAFKERIPLKIGATSDPFPPIEVKEHITHDCLRVLCDIDYPIQISTKNPEVFLSYAHEFIGANIAFNVSCSFLNDDIARRIEVGAISPMRRLVAIKELANMGFKVTVRLQPFILPYSEDEAEKFIKAIKETGAWAFQTEGLKLRLAMSEKEQKIYAKIGDILGFDILKDFKCNGVIESGDRVYSDKVKRRILKLYNGLSIKYGIRFYNADNLVDSQYGCGSQCCGTEVLHDYKIYGGAYRSIIFGDSPDICSTMLGKCLVNFARAAHGKKTFKTIDEISQEYIRKEEERKRVSSYMEKHKQLSLFDN